MATGLGPLVRLDSGALLDDFFAGQGLPWGALGTSQAAQRRLLVDVCEKPDSYELRVDVPVRPSAPRCAALRLHHSARADAGVGARPQGIPKENIGLDIEGKTVKVSTQQTQEEEEKEAGTSPEDVTWHRVERSTVYASRALRFPENADMSQARRR
jgi:HSP20 family molecular chaperone IbpA